MDVAMLIFKVDSVIAGWVEEFWIGIREEIEMFL